MRTTAAGAIAVLLLVAGSVSALMPTWVTPAPAVDGARDVVWGFASASSSAPLLAPGDVPAGELLAVSSGPDVYLLAAVDSALRTNTYEAQGTPALGGGSGCPVDKRAVVDIEYRIDGGKARSDLRGRVSPGSTVSVEFKMAKHCVDRVVTLVSYTAPSSRWDPAKAHLQQIHDIATGAFGAGSRHTMSVVVPDCYFQVDFVMGPAITRFDPPTRTYSSQGRLFSADNGGSGPCDVPPDNCGGAGYSAFSESDQATFVLSGAAGPFLSFTVDYVDGAGLSSVTGPDAGSVVADTSLARSLRAAFDLQNSRNAHPDWIDQVFYEVRFPAALLEGRTDVVLTVDIHVSPPCLVTSGELHGSEPFAPPPMVPVPEAPTALLSLAGLAVLGVALAAGRRR